MASKSGISIIFLSATLALQGPVARAQSATELKTELQTLYPNLSAELFDQKLAAAQSPFTFFRSFIPYYYKLISKGEATDGGLAALKQEPGWCVGDAHPENFGAVLLKGGKPIFTVNDLDDAGPCPLFADALRFFTSILLNNPNQDLGPLIKAYQNGLSGQLIATPLNVTILLNQAAQDGPKPPSKDFASPSTLKRDSSSINPSSAETASIQLALRAAYGPAAVLIDAFKTAKTGGGSSGLTRFEVLCNLPSPPNETISNPQIIEFKQMVTPGISPVAIGPVPDTVKRVISSLHYEQGPDASTVYNVQKVAGMAMLLRPRWVGNHGVNISGLSALELAEISQFEANRLGLIHSGTASSQFVKQASLLNDSDWIKAATRLAGDLESSFSLLHNAP